MARLTKEEKLKSIEQKQADLEMQKKKLQAEINKEKRNARTKRLIESATTIESILDITLTKENATYYSECIRFGLIVQHFLGKELIYYPEPNFNDTFYHILKYSAIKKYDIAEPWYEIIIELEDGNKVIINSMYLQEMQNSSFLSDYRSMPIEESEI